MDILNSGSFVPLDNREKIEQLKFTAKELAGEAAKTVGFQNNGPTNQQLALEMWKGAEYVCRAHEEATIRNIFLSSFLEKLRDLARAIPSRSPSQSAQGPNVFGTQNTSSETTTPPPPPVPKAAEPVTPEARTDEYLGIVPTVDELDREVLASYADECVPGFDAEIEALVDRLDEEQSNSESASSSMSIESQPEQTSAVNSANVSPSESDLKATEENPPSATARDEAHTGQGESTEPGAVESIVLKDKEPFSFDSCIVTAVVQLLPEVAGIRKCVVSVRSHDFSPRVVIAELSSAEIRAHILDILGPALDQYRDGLPAMGAERLKKEKSVSKKASKPAAKGNKPGTAATKSDSTAPVSTEAVVADQNQQGLFAT